MVENSTSEPTRSFSVGEKVAPEADGRRAGLDRVDRGAEHHLRPDRMQGELEPGDDTEIAAAAAQRPEQVGVVLPARVQQAAVGCDHVRREQVVDAEAVARAQPADAARQRQAGDAGVGDQAAGRREAEGLGVAVDVAPGGAALDPGAAPFGVDPHGAHERQVEHQPAIAHGVARDVVAAAADGHRQAMLAGEADGVDDVGDAAAAHDGVRAAIDHRVPHGPCRVVARIAVDQHLALQAAAQGSQVQSWCRCRRIHDRALASCY